jgi:hypothetical protein
MTYAVLLLAGVVAWLLYRRQAADGTLPTLSIRGAQVAVTNVDAVERRRVWRYQGPAGLYLPPDGYVYVSRRGWYPIGNPWDVRSDLPPGTIRLVPGAWYSDRVSLQALQNSPSGMMASGIDWLGYDAWWAPEIVTASEATQLGVIEIPSKFVQPKDRNV